MTSNYVEDEGNEDISSLKIPEGGWKGQGRGTGDQVRIGHMYTHHAMHCHVVQRIAIAISVTE